MYNLAGFLSYKDFYLFFNLHSFMLWQIFFFIFIHKIHNSHVHKTMEEIYQIVKYFT